MVALADLITFLDYHRDLAILFIDTECYNQNWIGGFNVEFLYRATSEALTELLEFTDHQPFQLNQSFTYPSRIMDDGDWQFDLYCLSKDHIILIPLTEGGVEIMTEVQAQEWLSKQELYTPVTMSLVNVNGITKAEFKAKVEKRYEELVAKLTIGSSDKIVLTSRDCGIGCMRHLTNDEAVSSAIKETKHLRDQLMIEIDDLIN